MSSFTTVDEVVRALRNEENAKVPWSDLYARIDRARAEADWLFLGRLLDALDLAPPGTRIHNTPGSHIAEIVFRALALVPGGQAVEALLARVQWVSQPTLVAAALANAQPPWCFPQAACIAADDPEAMHVVAAWMHESVYHDPAQFVGNHTFRAFAEIMRELGHPLAHVPLALSSLEAEMKRGHPHISPLGYGSWSLMPQTGAGELDERVARDVRATEYFEETWTARVRGIFSPAGVVTNARVEAMRYLLDAPVDVEHLGAPLLRALAPDCMTGRLDLDDEDDDESLADPSSVVVRVRRMEPSQALAWFLHFAVGWRCYGTYAGVGPGRLRAYDGLAALCELGPEAPWSEVDKAARERHFAHFTAETKWFDQVCEDFGCLVLNPARDVVTLVAETDSD